MLRNKKAGTYVPATHHKKDYTVYKMPLKQRKNKKLYVTVIKQAKTALCAVNYFYIKTVDST